MTSQVNLPMCVLFVNCTVAFIYDRTHFVKIHNEHCQNTSFHVCRSNGIFAEKARAPPPPKKRHRMACGSLRCVFSLHISYSLSGEYTGLEISILGLLSRVFHFFTKAQVETADQGCSIHNRCNENGEEALITVVSKL